MGLFKDIRSGVVRWATSLVLGHLAPYLWGAVVIAAGVVQGLPIAYVLAAGSVGYGAVYWGLNNRHAWTSRLKEEDSIVLGPPVFIVAHHEAENMKLGVQARIELVNRANYRINWELDSAEFYLHTADRKNKREALGEPKGIKNTVSAHASDRINTAAVMIDDFENENRIEGRLQYTVKFGKTLMKHNITHKKRVVGVRQTNGAWSFEAAVIAD